MVPVVISIPKGSFFQHKAKTLKYIDNEVSVSLYQNDFTNIVRRQKLNTAIFIDGILYVLKVSVRTIFNTFGDLIDSV